MRHPERGSTIPLIVGFAAILLVAIAVVIDASAAYLQHEDLVAVADGASLRGADLGAEGGEVYSGGLSEEARLHETRAAAQRAVDAYLDQIGARQRFPGLRAEVGLDAARDVVVVHLVAPARLPLHVPGSPDRPTIGAQSGSAVQVE